MSIQHLTPSGVTLQHNDILPRSSTQVDNSSSLGTPTIPINEGATLLRYLGCNRCMSDRVIL